MTQHRVTGASWRASNLRFFERELDRYDLLSARCYRQNFAKPADSPDLANVNHIPSLKLHYLQFSKLSGILSVVRENVPALIWGPEGSGKLYQLLDTN